MASGAWLQSRLKDNRFAPYQTRVDPWYNAGRRETTVNNALPSEDVTRFNGETATHTFADTGSDKPKKDDSSSSESDGGGGRRSKRTKEPKKKKEGKEFAAKGSVPKPKKQKKKQHNQRHGPTPPPPPPARRLSLGSPVSNLLRFITPTLGLDRGG